MAGFQWGTALGAGAKSALRTFETLEKVDREREDSERADRVLKLREEAAARQSRLAAKAEADENRRQAIFAGTDVGGAQPPAAATPSAPAAPAGGLRLPADSAQAGAAMSEQQAQQRGGVAPPEPVATVESEPEAAPEPAPARAPAREPAPSRQRMNYAKLQENLLRGGFVKEATAVGQLMTQDAERELRRVQTAHARSQLTESQIKIGQQAYNVHAIQAGQLAEQLPSDNNLFLTPAMRDQTSAITDQLMEAKKALPDGRDAEVVHNDDGSIELKFTDRETGKVVGGQKIATVGQLRQVARMAGIINDPVTYNQWITDTALSARKAELHELDVLGKREDIQDKRASRVRANQMHDLDTQAKTEAIATAKDTRARARETHALDVETKDTANQQNWIKLAKERAEYELIGNFEEAMKNPAQNEDRLREYAELLGTLSPKDWLYTEDVEDPETGAKSKVTRNKLIDRIDGMVPQKESERITADGKVVPFTLDDAMQVYVKAIPKWMQETGGDISRVEAMLRHQHDVKFKFRRGAYDVQMRTTLAPILKKALSDYQVEQQSKAAERKPKPLFRPGSPLDRLFGSSQGQEPTEGSRRTGLNVGGQ